MHRCCVDKNVFAKYNLDLIIANSEIAGLYDSVYTCITTVLRSLHPLSKSIALNWYGGSEEGL